MHKKICLLTAALSLFACSGLETTPPNDSFALIKKSSKKHSQWFYDSLPLCNIQGSELDDFVVPNQVNLWDRVRDGFRIDDHVNSRIQREINWYARHPNFIARVSERSAKYLHFVVEELDRRNLPLELALLPIVESAYDPFAYSHGQASGMWQIIPGTGKMLGLKQSWWYDGRRDVAASTLAALDYLESLYKQMDGDWLLALASYNSGAGNVRRAIKLNESKGKPTNYWALELPKETEHYIPRLMAIKALIEHPEIYSIQLFDVPDAPYFEMVDIESQIDLAQAAEMAGMTIEELYALNPGFNRWATDPNGPHKLLLPVDKAGDFIVKLAAIPKQQRVTWERYTIKGGDTLSTIARHYRTTTSLLQSINDIDGSTIRLGQTLLVPQAAQEFDHYTLSLKQRVQRKQSNGKGTKIQYVVRAGDSFWSIAKRFNVTNQEVAKWNAMAPSDTIRPGQKLVIWNKKNANRQANNTVRKVAYKVRSGDSLALIADKFNLKVKDILLWNQVNPKQYLQPGDDLTLFVDVTNTN